jgi:hypothetical protein
MWEYATMWHRARWEKREGRIEVAGWDEWVMIPAGMPAPPADAGEVAALNFMGRLRWELMQVEPVSETPPRESNVAHQERLLYRFKRPLSPYT